MKRGKNVGEFRRHASQPLRFRSANREKARRCLRGREDRFREGAAENRTLDSSGGGS